MLDKAKIVSRGESCHEDKHATQGDIELYENLAYVHVPVLSLIFISLISSAHSTILEQIPGLPQGWSYVSTPSDDQPITLSIHLRQQNIEKLEDYLKNVSTPCSPEYGNYLSGHQVSALFAPSNESVDAVALWVHDASCNVTYDGDSVTLQTDVGSANQLLNADYQYYRYQDKDEDTELLTLMYSVPDDIAAHVEMVTPTIYFGGSSGSSIRRIDYRDVSKVVSQVTEIVPQSSTPVWINRTCLIHDADIGDTIGPGCIKLMYNISYTPDVASGSKVGFGSFLNESAQYTDLAAFEKNFGISSQSFFKVFVNDGQANQDANHTNVTEANMDVQTIVGVSHPLPVTEFVTFGSPPFVPDLEEQSSAENSNEPFLPHFRYLLSQPDDSLPQVISHSYGAEEQTVPKIYAKRICNLIGMMGLRGVTIVIASGDTGVGTSCQSNDGAKIPQYGPTFPASCPYVLSVGGTQSLEPEVA